KRPRAIAAPALCGPVRNGSEPGRTAKRIRFPVAIPGLSKGPDPPLARPPNRRRALVTLYSEPRRLTLRPPSSESKSNPRVAFLLQRERHKPHGIGIIRVEIQGFTALLDCSIILTGAIENRAEVPQVNAGNRVHCQCFAKHRDGLLMTTLNG